jgi:hypothetical protein
VLIATTLLHETFDKRAQTNVPLRLKSDEESIK